MRQIARTFLLALAFVASSPTLARAQEETRGEPDLENLPKRRPGRRGAIPKPNVRPPAREVNDEEEDDAQPGSQRPPQAPSRSAPGPSVIMPSPSVGKEPPGPTRGTPPPPTRPIDKREAARNAKSVVMSFDKRDLVEVIQFVSNFTGRNFILPDRVAGKITILSNTPIPPDEVWNVFVAALDANNWTLYPVGHYWKLSEKKASARANIPTFLEQGQEAPPTEQMVTKLFKLRNVEADQMRNTLNQFTSLNADFQIFPPDTLIISDLGLNMRRLERLLGQLDQPGGSEEIHIVQVLYAGAQELQQKLTEIFTAPQRPGQPRPMGIIAEPGQPAQPIAAGIPQPAPGAAPSGGGPVQVSKIIAEERTNKLIVIAGARSFARVLELIKQLDVPTGEGGVHVYNLQHAKAEDVAATLQSLAQGAAAARRRGAGPGGVPQPQPFPPGVPGGPAPGAPGGPGGATSAELFAGEVKITADKNTNSLVIIASASDYRNLVKVIEKLDVARREVLVEAVIMEVTLQDELNLGVSTHGGTVLDNVNFRGARGSAPLVFGSELGGLNSLGGLGSLAGLNGFLAGLQGPPITVGNVSLPSFAILLQALQTSSDVNVISTPHVTMVDNTEGEITVGQNVPFPSGFAPPGLGSIFGTGGQTQQQPGATPGTTTTNPALGLGLAGLGSFFAPIQRQNVELRLRIKPQISASDTVRLEVDEQTEEIASIDPQRGPTTSKRTAKTTVVVKDQETVVLGGLIQERNLKDVKRVPVLGSLPVLGYFFRSETTRKTKTNLLLFLTPYIIRDQSDYRRIFERKMAERAEFVKRFYGGDIDVYSPPIDYEHKPGPLSRMRRKIEQEMSRLENGGAGAADERVIAPVPSQPPPGREKREVPVAPQHEIPTTTPTPNATPTPTPNAPTPAPLHPVPEPGEMPPPAGSEPPPPSGETKPPPPAAEPRPPEAPVPRG